MIRCVGSSWQPPAADGAFDLLRHPVGAPIFAPTNLAVQDTDPTNPVAALYRRWANGPGLPALDPQAAEAAARAEEEARILNRTPVVPANLTSAPLAWFHLNKACRW